MSTDFPFWQMKFGYDSISAHAGFGWSKHKSCIIIFLPLHLLLGTESEPKAKNSTAAIKAEFAFSTAHSACWRTDWPSPLLLILQHWWVGWEASQFILSAPSLTWHLSEEDTCSSFEEKKTISWSFVARMIMTNQSNGEVIAPEVVNPDGIILVC